MFYFETYVNQLPLLYAQSGNHQSRLYDPLNHSASIPPLSQVDPKYRKKIEAVVRKPAKTEEEEFPSPCPFCENMIAETELNCDKCKRSLPYCIASGRHVVKGDLTECPYCHFPAIRSELAK